MKHQITVLLCVLAVGTLGVLSVKKYDHYKLHQQQVESSVISSQKKQQAIDAQEKKVFQSNLSQLEAQCAKDKAAYAVLTPLQQAKTTPPNCNVNLVQ